MLIRACLILLLMPALSAAQPLVITAPAAPGGGWDQTARAMQRVFAAVEPGVSVQVDNVSGAAGTIGLSRFIQSERGNPGALLITGLVMVSGVILNGSPVSLTDTTPIARLTGEYEVIVVPTASPYQSLADLVTAFKKEPRAISWGGGSAGGTDDLLIRLLAEQVGLPPSSVNYIAFSGGGAALAAVLGGQLSAAVSGHAEFAGQIASGQLRVLAVSSPARVAGIDAPTIRDAGIDLDLANWRAIVAPPGLSAAEQTVLTDRITRLATSPQWQATLAQNGWEDQYLTGQPLRQFLLAEQSRIDAVLRRLAATETATTTRPMTLTPMTLPASVGILFAGALALVIGKSARQRLPISGPGARMVAAIIAALAGLPVAFWTLGFVASSTLLFGIAATAMRGHQPTVRGVGRDLIVGAIFSAILFIVFTRGLGVSLPAPGLF